MAVIAGGGAEPLDALFLAPGLFAVQKAVGVGLGNGVVHELKACVAAHEDLRDLAAEKFCKERACACKALELAVVARVHAANDAVGRIAQHRQ